MKRYFTLLLLCTLMVNILGLSAYATETECSGYDSLIRKATEAFPEYAERINNPKDVIPQNTREKTDRELVLRETRAVSDKEFVTYTEYSDGVILLSGYEFTAESTAVSNIKGQTSRDIIVDIEATCVNDSGYKGYFYLEGVSYSLVYSDYDYITDTGTARREGYCTKATQIINNPEETATSYATLAYELQFQIGPGGY